VSISLGQAILTKYFSLGYWRSFRSGHYFDGQALKDCLDIVHIDIVEIWNLNDRDQVSVPHFSSALRCSW